MTLQLAHRPTAPAAKDAETDPYAAYCAGRAAIITAWMADPANNPTDGTPTPSRYQLDTALNEHYRLNCPGSPDYRGHEAAA